jgi:hypothetical protein
MCVCIFLVIWSVKVTLYPLNPLWSFVGYCLLLLLGFFLLLLSPPLYWLIKSVLVLHFIAFCLFSSALWCHYFS